MRAGIAGGAVTAADGGTRVLTATGADVAAGRVIGGGSGAGSCASATAVR